MFIQHEFIKGCTEAAPIRALIAEFKAEVIEEEEKLGAEEELKVCYLYSASYGEDCISLYNIMYTRVSYTCVCKYC